MSDDWCDIVLRTEAYSQEQDKLEIIQWLIYGSESISQICEFVEVVRNRWISFLQSALVILLDQDNIYY